MRQPACPSRSASPRFCCVPCLHTECTRCTAHMDSRVSLVLSLTPHSQSKRCRFKVRQGYCGPESTWRPVCICECVWVHSCVPECICECLWVNSFVPLCICECLWVHCCVPECICECMWLHSCVTVCARKSVFRANKQTFTPVTGRYLYWEQKKDGGNVAK